MTGPNHSIICRLTSTGQGAALCATARRLLMSYRRRTASGSRSSLMNMVGTNWTWVTRYRSIAFSVSSASNFGSRATVPPCRWVAIADTSGAAW